MNPHDPSARMRNDEPQLRVCHVNLSREFRGGERQTLALIEALSSTLQQRIVVRRNAPLHETLAKLTAPTIEIAAVSNSLLSAFAATRGVDLLHIHEGRSVAVGALRSLRGTPFVVTRRVMAPRARVTTRWCYARASRVVGVSEFVSRDMRAFDSRLKTQTILDCTPILPSPPSERVEQLRQTFGGKLLIGQIGELNDAHKGQRLTLEVARHLADSDPQVHFLLIGGGKDEAILRAEAADLPNVYFTGRVDDIASYYAVLDLFVFPSRAEALGSSILEAMSFGLPGVAAAVGGIPEVLVDGINGFLFPAGDAGRMLERLRLLVAVPELRARLGRQARQSAVALAPSRMAKAYLELYDQIVPRSTRRK